MTLIDIKIGGNQFRMKQIYIKYMGQSIGKLCQGENYIKLKIILMPNRL